MISETSTLAYRTKNIDVLTKVRCDRLLNRGAAYRSSDENTSETIVYIMATDVAVPPPMMWATLQAQIARRGNTSGHQPIEVGISLYH